MSTPATTTTTTTTVDASAEITSLLNLPRFQTETRLIATAAPIGTEPEKLLKAIKAFRGYLAHVAKLSAESAEVTVGKVRKGRDGEPERCADWRTKSGSKIVTADGLFASIKRASDALAKCESVGAKATLDTDAPIRQQIAEWIASL